MIGRSQGCVVLEEQLRRVLGTASEQKDIASASQRKTQNKAWSASALLVLILIIRLFIHVAHFSFCLLLGFLFLLLLVVLSERLRKQACRPERVTPNIRVHSLHTPTDPRCPLSSTYNRSSFKLSIRFTAANFFVFLALPMVDGVLCLVEGRWLVGEWFACKCVTQQSLVTRFDTLV